MIRSMTIPKLGEGEVLCTYRAAMRPNNAHAFVNSCFRATVGDGGTVSNVVLGKDVLGIDGFSPHVPHSEHGTICTTKTNNDRVLAQPSV